MKIKHESIIKTSDGRKVFRNRWILAVSVYNPTQPIHVSQQLVEDALVFHFHGDNWNDTANSLEFIQETDRLSRFPDGIVGPFQIAAHVQFQVVETRFKFAHVMVKSSHTVIEIIVRA